MLLINVIYLVSLISVIHVNGRGHDDKATDKTIRSMSALLLYYRNAIKTFSFDVSVLRYCKTITGFEEIFINSKLKNNMFANEQRASNFILNISKIVLLFGPMMTNPLLFV